MMFLKTILTRKPDDLLKKTYEVQKLKPAKFDWSTIVQNDKRTYEIDVTDDEITKMSKKSFKKYVDKKVNKRAFEELFESKKSKVKDLILITKSQLNQDYKLPMQQYLQTSELTTEAKKILFSLRCREFNLKSNYKSMWSISS